MLWGLGFFTLRSLPVITLLLALAPAASAARALKKDTGSYQTGFVRWRAADNAFAAWQLNGTRLGATGALEFDPGAATAETDPYAPGAYFGHNYYNGSSYFVGEATSPVVTTSFNYSEAIASWNATTPAGSWIEVQIQAQFDTRWSKWYTLGIWASDYSTVERHSVSAQGDTDATVAIDTLVVKNKKTTTHAFQVKLRLFSADGITVPSVQNASVASSLTPPSKPVLTAGDPNQWNRLVPVPECSQMVYPDGGEVWCSPTSTSMVLGYWSGDTGPCEPRVRAAVEGVFDWKYDGHGNWPFNTAYAGAQGYEGYVARLTGLDKAEAWIAAGVPVILSPAWDKGELTGASIESTAGHLLVLVGFDAAGNPIANDPAAPADADVQRTYLRSELEALWLEHSGGTVYLIYPQGHTVPDL